MIQTQQRVLTHPDPVARLVLFGLFALVFAAFIVPTTVPAVQAEQAPVIVIATPTMGVPPTEAPAAALAVPTIAPPTVPPTEAEAQDVQQVVIERQIIVEVTAPPAPTEVPAPTATPPLMLAAPSGTILVIATPGQTDQEFIDSFGPTPDPNAKCAFVGCLHQP